MKFLAFLLFLTAVQFPIDLRNSRGLTLTKKELHNKIMGGWAGQAIGVTLGVPGETPLSGNTISANEESTWHEGYLKETFENNPGLYEDIYMDLTFVEVIEREGIQAPVKSFSKVYKETEIPLWHANQAARFNILHGINPSASGHWLNNPHADDIDFQMVADFAGLMCPGLPGTAAEICNKVGHIMNYGDGYYGGLYIATLYSLAFTSANIEYIIHEGLKSVPKRSSFYQCINDVLRWHRQYPDDWKRAWSKLQKNWAENIGCPGYVDAKLNAAFITLGLLYGKGDFSDTMEITGRAGKNSGCSASSAGGILGVILGYDNIPEHWKQNLRDIEKQNFKYTTLSLEDAYDASYRHALKAIEQNGGRVRNENVIIRQQRPVEARLEKSFEGHYPVEKRSLENKIIDKEFEFEFEGIGFVLRGESAPPNSLSDHTILAELYLNNKFIETATLPTKFSIRKSELFWKYQLPHDKYIARIKILNPSKEHQIKVTDVIIYDVNIK